MSPFLTTFAAGEGHDACGRRAAGVPGLDSRRFAVAATGAAESRAGGQGELIHLALGLVAAAAAFDEQGGGVLGHVASIGPAPTSPANKVRRNCMNRMARERRAPSSPFGLSSHPNRARVRFGYRAAPSRNLQPAPRTYRRDRAGRAIPLIYGLRLLAGATPGA